MSKQSIMNKEFVPYEEALELKELGFDEPCFFAFDNCSTPMRCTDLRTNEQKFNGVNYNSSSYTSQPTFSQAFRWFREKYKNYVFQIYESRNQLYVKQGYNYTVDTIEVRHQGDNVFKTYEEAELACLRKLIEIVKQKK